MEEQSGREFASTDPPKGAQDAALQKPGLSPEVPLNPRRRLQHLQRPTPPYIGPNAPKLPRCGDAYVARGSCGFLKLMRRRPLAFFVRRRDSAIICASLTAFRRRCGGSMKARR